MGQILHRHSIYLQYVIQFNIVSHYRRLTCPYVFTLTHMEVIQLKSAFYFIYKTSAAGTEGWLVEQVLVYGKY
jgi:hypothetical protein